MNGNGVGSGLKGGPKELVIGDIVETDLNEWPTKELVIGDIVGTVLKDWPKKLVIGDIVGTDL